MENIVDPDQTPHSVASDLSLHCLLRFVCPRLTVNMILTNLIWLVYQSEFDWIASGVKGVNNDADQTRQRNY